MAGIVFKGDGIALFKQVSDAMRGEKAARAEGFQTKLIAPPPDMRMGCDLALEVNLVEKPGLERAFNKQQVPYLRVVPLSGNNTNFCEIIKMTDLGEWIMVKSGNMKLTFAKQSGEIVNISGGGCPDIPYLGVEMVGKTLFETQPPHELGYTLCATMLQRAYEEALLIFNGNHRSPPVKIIIEEQPR